MPGRDELIQQNIARAQASSQAPRPQESAGKSASSGLGAPRSFFGGNLEVYSALDKIGFQGALGDASMRGNTAYIRIWKRAGTAQQPSQPIPATEAPTDELADLQNDIWDLQGSYASEFGLFDPEEPIDPVDNYLWNGAEAEEDDVFGFGYVSSEYLEADTSAQTQRQQSVATQTPTSSAAPSGTSSVALTTSPSAPPSPGAVGTVKSANPTGFLGALGRVGRSLLGVAAGRPAYVGGAMGTAASSTSGEMMWQFLFNPSELELEAGPEFKNAETWGVSDKGNSGQPLHWSHNKNALLKFNSVLLNGFVFGRKVEALEQGLIELFMARDGGGQHGPHVLEFVWGKRVFGPCVIRNINIKEKMWDEGEVVNAELSFTLEQVPEWTINDGFVDVARPGRLATEGSPTTPGSSASNPAGTANPTGGNPNPGGGQKPDQKSKATPSGPSAQFCTQATNAYSNFNNLGGKSSKSWTDNVFGTPEARATQLGNEYSTILNANRSVTGALGGIDSKCSKGCPQSSYYFPNTATLNVNAYLGCVQSCSYQYASKINGSYFDNVRCPKPQFVRPA